MYKIGLVGLPNVGKSSIFNFFTGNKALVSNRPFATIKPNISLVDIFDSRLENLFNYYKSNSIFFSPLEIIDIAGLIEGSHEKSHGSNFLSKIREVDLIVHVLRSFSKGDIFHVNGNVDPIRDFEIINLELLFSDYQQLENILKNLKKRGSCEETTFLEKLKNNLKNNVFIKDINFSDIEKEYLKKYNFLTTKPHLILVNCDDDNLELHENFLICEELNQRNSKDIVFFDLLNNYKYNNDDDKENKKKQFFDFFGKKIKDILNLKVFFTAGKKESRSWLAKKSMNAHDCSGLIHSEIKKRFVRVEIYSYADWERLYNKIGNFNFKINDDIVYRKKKDYLINDGDICIFL